MKSFLVEIFINDKETTYHNKTSEGFYQDDIRRVIAMLEEIKFDLVDSLRQGRQFIESKKSVIIA